MISCKNEHVEVSIVFPVYNENKYLMNAISRVKTALDQFVSSYELIIAEDGSTDGTRETAESLARTHSFIKHIHGSRRLGRGIALNRAFEASSGAVLVYMDIDLATDLAHLQPLIEAISREHYDIATGSRLHLKSKVARGFRRRLTSSLYSFWVRIMLNCKVKDYQCGFKSFKRQTVLKLINEVEAKHWFWDTEMIVRATNRGYAVKEIPITWKSGKGTKVNIIIDSYRMGIQVLKLRRRLY